MMSARASSPSALAVPAGALDATGPAGGATDGTAGILSAYARLPLRFEPNAGQTDAHVLFAAHGAGYGLFLTAGAATLVLAAPLTPTAPPTATAGLTSALPLPTPALPLRAAVRLRLVGADPAARLVGQGALPGVASYLLGRDPRAWRTGLPTYSQVAATGVYSGIDLTYDGTQGRLEYSFVVAPGADPGAIGLAVDGARGLALDASGALTVTTAAGPLAQAAPLAYQEVGGRRVPVAVRLALSGASGFGFVMGTYDHRLPLVIDPVLGYGTYLGGGGADQGNAVAVDRRGDAYVAGQTASTALVTVTGALSPTYGGGGYDAFVTEVNPAGTGLVYSTYLGGSGTDVAAGVAVDARGDAYVTGHTNSPNFPLARAYQASLGGGSDDAFLTELGPGGTAVVYSTYLGGTNSDEATGVALDGAGDALVEGTTYSVDFPATAGALRTANPNGGPTAFVARVNPAASGTASLVYGTYLGGSGPTHGMAVAADAAGDGYVTGDTYGPTFPLSNAYQSAAGNTWYAFASKLSPDGSHLFSDN